MLQLLLPLSLQGPFLAALARYARPMVQVFPLRAGLRLAEAEVPEVAAALTLGAFPAYEGQRLGALLARHFSAFSPAERQQMLALAPGLIREAESAESLYAGYTRPLRLARAFAEILSVRGSLDFPGFCRFRLRGHESFLHYVLTLAGDRLLMQEEDRTYGRLLQRAAVCPPGERRELHVFFSPDRTFRLWERTARGIRDREGGSYLGSEAALVANLIALRPARLVVHDPQAADPVLLSHLHRAFGPALSWAGGVPRA